MNICYNGHDEIVFDGRYCPMCELQEDIDQLEEELNDLRGKLIVEEERREL